MIKITTSQYAPGWKYLDRAKCFDVLKLMVFGLARVFQQSRTFFVIFVNLLKGLLSDPVLVFVLDL